MSITAALSMHARLRPERIALRVDDDRLSWSRLDALVHRLAAHLAASVPDGRPIALHLPNSPVLVLLFLAAVRAGREAQVLDPAWPGPLLDRVLAELSQPALFTADAGPASRPEARRVDASWSLSAVADALGAPATGHALVEPPPDSSFYVGFTSGSTGMPKGYRRTHRSWLDGFVGDDAEFGIGPDDVVLAPGPMTHSLALYALVRGLNAGATVVFCRRFRPGHVLPLVARAGVSVLYGVPTQFRMLLDRAETRGSGPYGSVRLLLSTGAKWPPEESARVRRVFPGAEFCEFYGSSELGFVTLARSSEMVPAQSVGRAFPGVGLTIRDESGDVLPPGRTGLVFAESAQLFQGYACGGPGSLAIRGGAASVGDLGCLDEQGFLSLVGRASRMIISAGRNIHPEEVEEALRTHPGIAAAAVLGVPEPERGERLVALLRLAGDWPPPRSDLIAHLRATLPLYKIPRHYGIVADWPTTALGKTDQAALRAIHAAGRFEWIEREAGADGREMPAAFGARTEMAADGATLCGPWRRPHQMLAMQAIDGAGSIHDDRVARRFGFRAGTIEGPTHFSQFAPLGARTWGPSWFETGCLSVEYVGPCYAGEEVRAFLRCADGRTGDAAIWMRKRDGTEVLRGSTSVGLDPPPTALQTRLGRAQRLSATMRTGAVTVGLRSGRRSVALPFDRRMGRLYPFSLTDKLGVITEPSPWYTRDGGTASPWGRAIIPLEMVSVLLRFGEDDHPFPPRPPGVDLFAAQEIRMLDGPLFTDCGYEIEHEVAGLGETRRTENLWIRTRVFRPGSQVPVAVMLLLLARFKETGAPAGP